MCNILKRIQILVISKFKGNKRKTFPIHLNWLQSRPGGCSVTPDPVKWLPIHLKSTMWMPGRPRPCEVASHSFKNWNNFKVQRKQRENVSHSFKLTSKSTRWMLGHPRPCEVASHSLAREITMTLPPLSSFKDPIPLTSKQKKLSNAITGIREAYCIAWRCLWSSFQPKCLYIGDFDHFIVGPKFLRRAWEQVRDPIPP